MTATPNVFALAASYWDPDPEDTGDRELAIKCSQDLRVLIREAWPLLEPARPFVANWHIDCVAEHLMAVSNGEIKRLIINVPPGTSKSSVASVLWPAWEWMMHPHLRWIVASYAEKFALRDSRKMRLLVQDPGKRATGTIIERRGYQGVLALLGQAWGLAEDQNAKGRYDTTAGGMRLATSVGGQVTGDHADRIVIDDPVDPRRARSELEREGANLWWDETMTSRFIDVDATAVLVQQRLHEDDLSGHLLASNENWHHLCLPAEYVPASQFTYPAKVKLPSGREITGDVRTRPGQLLDERRMSDELLAPLRARAYVFAGQYQQRPAPEGGGMFQRDWLLGERVERWQPGFHRYLRLGFDQVIASWDMAFKDTKTSDYVVGQIWGFHGADCYLLAQIRARLDFTATLHAFAALNAFEPFGPMVNAKLVEDKANGTAVIATLKRKVRSVIAIEPQGGKVVRAAAVAPMLEAHNVILPASDTIPCPPHYVDEAGRPHALAPTTVADFVHELASFPMGANDDQVDAMSQALTWANPRESQRQPELPGNGRADTIMSGVLDMRS